MWETATEINNDYFVVERSTNSITWESIIQVDGAGNSTQTLAYQTQDTKPLEGISYYRLRQCDYDGTNTVSSIEIADRNVDNNLENISVYPNPISLSSGINILLNNALDENATIKLVDIKGSVIMSKPSISEGATITLPSNMSTGLYLLIVSTNDKSRTLRINVIE